jgi:hypothetical protein
MIMNGEKERTWKKATVAFLKVYTSTHLQRMRRSMETHQDVPIIWPTFQMSTTSTQI